MAIVLTKLERIVLGDKVLAIVSAYGDGTTITAKSVGLERIYSAWCQGWDETTPYRNIINHGTYIEFGPTSAGKTNVFFLVGY